jgi:hypothetical protein
MFSLFQVSVTRLVSTFLSESRLVVAQLKIVVATVAFGMGIDKANVRFVFHFGVAHTLETFFQVSKAFGLALFCFDVDRDSLRLSFNFCFFSLRLFYFVRFVVRVPVAPTLETFFSGCFWPLGLYFAFPSVGIICDFLSSFALGFGFFFVCFPFGGEPLRLSFKLCFSFFWFALFIPSMDYLPCSFGLTHSLLHTHSLTHSLPLTPTHSHSLTLTHSLTHSPAHSLTHSPTHSFTHSLTPLSLARSLIVCSGVGTCGQRRQQGLCCGVLVICPWDLSCVFSCIFGLVSSCLVVLLLSLSLSLTHSRLSFSLSTQSTNSTFSHSHISSGSLGVVHLGCGRSNCSVSYLCICNCEFCVDFLHFLGGGGGGSKHLRGCFLGFVHHHASVAGLRLRDWVLRSAFHGVLHPAQCT